MEYLKKLNYNRLCIIVLFIFSFFLTMRATMGGFRYDEIDSIMLPAISIQHRGSLVIVEEDLKIAQEEFASLYQGIDSYDDLRMSKLRKITEDEWLPFYFPVYPAVCIPVKLMFSVIGVPQERCFTVTNALLVILALLTVYKGLKTSDRQKFAALLLLIVSPVVYYVNYICYETFMFSMITISMVLYHRENYKSSALFLAFSAMSNASAMAAGLVMIADYFVKMFAAAKGKSLLQIAKDNFVETLLYALMFTPGFAQFIFTRVYLNRGVKIGTGSLLGDYGRRFLAYLFDPNLGLTSFAVLQLLFAVVCLVLMFKKRTLRPLVWVLFLLMEILGFSIVYHINCGMIYCSRYLVWSYPILAVFIATDGLHLVSKDWGKTILSCTMVAVSLLLFLANGNPHPFYLNNVSKWLLDHIPAVYSPYYATFASRTLHVDGGYWETDPVYYFDSAGDNAGEVRKLLYIANEESVVKILSELTGTEESIEHLKKQIERNGLDGERHYINFGPGSAYQLREESYENKWEMTEGELLVQDEAFDLHWTGSYYEGCYPFTVCDQQDYTIQLKLDENFDFSNVELFFVDFYEQSGYDNPQQQVDNFLTAGTFDYTFSINAGKIETGKMDAYIRVIYFPKEHPAQSAVIELLRIQETILAEIGLDEADVEWIQSLS